MTLNTNNDGVSYKYISKLSYYKNLSDLLSEIILILGCVTKGKVVDLFKNLFDDFLRHANQDNRNLKKKDFIYFKKLDKEINNIYYELDLLSNNIINNIVKSNIRNSIGLVNELFKKLHEILQLNDNRFLEKTKDIIEEIAEYIAFDIVKEGNNSFRIISLNGELLSSNLYPVFEYNEGKIYVKCISNNNNIFEKGPLKYYKESGYILSELLVINEIIPNIKESLNYFISFLVNKFNDVYSLGIPYKQEKILESSRELSEDTILKLSGKIEIGLLDPKKYFHSFNVTLELDFDKLKPANSDFVELTLGYIINEINFFFNDRLKDTRIALGELNNLAMEDLNDEYDDYDKELFKYLISDIKLVVESNVNNNITFSIEFENNSIGDSNLEYKISCYNKNENGDIIILHDLFALQNITIPSSTRSKTPLMIIDVNQLEECEGLSLTLSNVTTKDTEESYNGILYFEIADNKINNVDIEENKRYSGDYLPDSDIKEINLSNNYNDQNIICGIVTKGDKNILSIENKTSNGQLYFLDTKSQEITESKNFVNFLSIRNLLQDFSEIIENMRLIFDSNNNDFNIGYPKKNIAINYIDNNERKTRENSCFSFNGFSNEILLELYQMKYEDFRFDSTSLIEGSNQTLEEYLLNFFKIIINMYNNNFDDKQDFFSNIAVLLPSLDKSKYLDEENILYKEELLISLEKDSKYDSVLSEINELNSIVSFISLNNDTISFISFGNSILLMLSEKIRHLYCDLKNNNSNINLCKEKAKSFLNILCMVINQNYLINIFNKIDHTSKLVDDNNLNKNSNYFLQESLPINNIIGYDNFLNVEINFKSDIFQDLFDALITIRDIQDTDNDFDSQISILLSEISRINNSNTNLNILIESRDQIISYLEDYRKCLAELYDSKVKKLENLLSHYDVNLKDVEVTIYDPELLGEGKIEVFESEHHKEDICCC